jgi:hypothetical protein
MSSLSRFAETLGTFTFWNVLRTRQLSGKVLNRAPGVQAEVAADPPLALRCDSGHIRQSQFGQNFTENLPSVHIPRADIEMVGKGRRQKTGRAWCVVKASTACFADAAHFSTFARALSFALMQLHQTFERHLTGDVTPHYARIELKKLSTL